MSRERTSAEAAKQAGPGRPTKLTRYTQSRICALLRQGATLEAASSASGVHRATLHDWISRGRQEPHTAFGEFQRAVETALAQAETDLTARIHEAAQSSWQAALALLERRFPQRWARRAWVQVDVARVERALAHVRDRVPTQAYDALIEALADDESVESCQF
jgi:transposase